MTEIVAISTATLQSVHVSAVRLTQRNTQSNYHTVVLLNRNLPFGY